MWPATNKAVINSQLISNDIMNTLQQHKTKTLKIINKKSKFKKLQAESKTEGENWQATRKIRHNNDDGQPAVPVNLSVWSVNKQTKKRIQHENLSPHFVPIFSSTHFCCSSSVSLASILDALTSLCYRSE